MHFSFVDQVLERDENRIVTTKAVTLAEEYLQDHFAGFPVLPGVFMLEAMVQAARALATYAQTHPARLVLGEVRALKYASLVRPGEVLRCTIERGAIEGENWIFKGRADVARGTGTEVCASGRFTLRPVRPESR